MNPTDKLPPRVTSEEGARKNRAASLYLVRDWLQWSNNQFDEDRAALTLRILAEQEAQLALAVEALESIGKNSCCNPCREAGLVAREALAKLRGGGDYLVPSSWWAANRFRASAICSAFW